MPLSLYFVMGLLLFGFPVLGQEEASPQDRLIVESLVRLNRFGRVFIELTEVI